MSKPGFDPTLRLLAVIAEMFGKHRQALRLFHASMYREALALDYRARDVQTLLQSCGLRSIVYGTVPGDIPDMLHDAARAQHPVLLGMRPDFAHSYERFACLAGVADGQLRIIEVAADQETITYPRPIGEYCTGEYVVLWDTVPVGTTMEAAMARLP